MKSRTEMSIKAPSLFYTKKEIAETKIFKLCIILALLFIVAVSIFNSLFYVTFVSGQSMYPGINKQGTSTVNAPASKSDKAYYTLTNTAKRNDIIIALHSSVPVIKRVIALAGDTVEITNSEGVYGVKVNSQFIDEPYIYSNAGMHKTYENFLRLRSYNSSIHLQDFSTCFNGNVLTIPQNCVFYLGDNRAISQDCSYYGPNTTENIVAKVIFVVPYGKTVIGYFWAELCKSIGI